jgi:hypothetical protein
MSRKETTTAAEKRHKVGHDITQVHYSSLYKQQVAEYFNQLSSARAKIQMSANEKMAALSNPDQLDIEESPQAPQAQDQLSAYEQLRLANIQRNTAIFESMGLAGGASKLLHAPLQRDSVKLLQKKSKTQRWTVMRLALLHVIEFSSVNNYKNALRIINKESMILQVKPCVTTMCC